MQPSVISTIDYPLNLSSDIKTVKIRSGRIWGILKNLKLLFVDLNAKPRPLVKIFDTLDNCLFIYVSSDGEYCLVLRHNALNHVCASDLQPVSTPQLPGTTIRTSTFFNNGKYLKPFLFMITDTYQVCYVNFNGNACYKVNLVAVDIPRDKTVNGVSIVLYKDGFYGLSIIYQDTIMPFILDQEFVEIKGNCDFKMQIGHTRHGSIFVENNYIGCITESPGQGQLLLEYILDINNSHPRLEHMLAQQIWYTLPPGKTLGFCVFDEFLFHFRNDGKVNIFMNGFQSEVDGFKVAGVKVCDYDTDNGELYAVYPQKVTRIRFDSNMRFRGTDAIRVWLYHRFMARNDEKSAAQCLVNISELTLNEKLDAARISTNMRFHVYRNVYEKMKEKKNPELNKAKMAIAIALYEIYTQIESCKPNPDIKAYCELTQELLKENLINMTTVRKTLDDYGWDSPLARLNNPSVVFDKLMERNEPIKAISILPKLSSDNDEFVNAALRVLSFDKAQVCNIVSKQVELNSCKYVPILTCENSREFVLELLNTGRLTNKWIAKLYAIALSKAPDVKQVEQFFIQFNRSNNGEIPCMIRTLNAEKQYSMLVSGLVAIQKYVAAATVAAKGDPISSFNLIPDDIDNEIKKRCAFTVLRSINRQKAGELANYLLKKYAGSGYDTSLLLEYLPSNTPISNLSSPLAEFTYNKKESSNEQKKNIGDALIAIGKASKLISMKENRAVVLTSTELCERCRKPFFNDEGVIYPCSHMLHVHCANQLIKDIKLDVDNNKIDYCQDCPICGYLSVRLMNEPFRGGVENGKDPFTTDPTKLSAMLNETNIMKKTSLFNL
ncbi:hypothetical protein TRFO_28581 [Tritrichomonas foetus]|uniref:RING-type domain-containing protein n=1 Tax=Tritrichomonas foetus TaxID=1144522 RepID=A0A1J4JXV2_9EUKA|nr:hypothetical protein TRFO_28581 [Tritrichomonas foetus]|eukprot:OHT03991.1 hypothetical protein TRFO_28581 [Tritrichomonas foetus]